MTDNGNRKRPVRTLEVENFSVIKKAKLEFGRITVLVGPQASGKSLLCKLAYFLGWEVANIAARSLVDRRSWGEFLGTVNLEFVSRFSIAGWLRADTRASFSSHQYSVSVSGVSDPLDVHIEFAFSNGFRKLYESSVQALLTQATLSAPAQAQLHQDLWVEISHLIDPVRSQPNIYVPSGRQLFTAASRFVAALDSPGLDEITRHFAGLIAWDPRWKVGMVTSGRGVTQGVEQEMNRIARGAVVMTGGEPAFLSSDGRRLPLSMLSSGTAEILPVLQVLNYLAYSQEHLNMLVASRSQSSANGFRESSPLIYLEEPEASVFPETQRELVNLFAWMANDPILSFDWVITTHSPYILTAFNTLIEAWRAAKKTGRRDEVAAIVPEHSWISEDDFAAYTIQENVLKPIFEKEAKGIEGSGLIDGDYLDDVSDTISNQFARLLEIEFADAT